MQITFDGPFGNCKIGPCSSHRSSQSLWRRLVECVSHSLECSVHRQEGMGTLWLIDALPWSLDVLLRRLRTRIWSYLHDPYVYRKSSFHHIDDTACATVDTDESSIAITTISAFMDRFYEVVPFCVPLLLPIQSRRAPWHWPPPYLHASRAFPCRVQDGVASDCPRTLCSPRIPHYYTISPSLLSTIMYHSPLTLKYRSITSFPHRQLP